jgi:CubicO group peptidase (beta-lactamase class C family)
LGDPETVICAFGSREIRLAGAAAAGFDPAGLGRVAGRIEQDIAAGHYDGARLLIARHGRVALDATLGFAERGRGRPLAADAVFAVMSLTKVMTAMAVLGRVERGDLALTMRVADLIPEFAAAGKSDITIGQLLTHTGGMGMGAPPVPAERQGDLAAVVAAVAAMPPAAAPGSAVSYSAATAFAMLGEILQRTDGASRPFRRILAEDLFAPLGMADTAIGLPERLRARRVPLVVTDDEAPELDPAALRRRDRLAGEATEMPGGGAFATAGDILRLAETLRCGGTLAGTRVLSPAVVRLMTRNHTGTLPNNLFAGARAAHLFAGAPAFLGLGLFLRGEGLFPSFMGHMASPGSFGGLGLGSMAFWVDPERELSFVMLTAGLIERVRSITRFQILSDMTFAALD